MSKTTPNTRGAAPKDPADIKTQVISVRLPSVELRREFAAKVQEDGLTIAGWTAMVVSAYVDGRLKVTEPPKQEAPKRPSFLVQADDDGSDGDGD